MTTEETLKHFKEICEADAEKQAERLLSEHRKNLEKRFSDHKEEALRRQKTRLQIEEEHILREENKNNSLKSLEGRKKLAALREELKDCLFVELRDRLANFMETPDYISLLKKQIKEALAFADGEEIHIYLDPTDESLLQRLDLDLRTNLMISRYSFSGGTRAVIPGKNILIDNSFESKLADARAAFQFTLTDDIGEEYKND